MSKLNSQISVFVVAVTLLVYSFVTNTFSSVINWFPGAAILSGAVLSVGIYVAIYRTIVFVVDKWFLRIIHPRHDLEGDWFYTINTVTAQGGPASYGICEIVREGDEYSFVGYHASTTGHEKQSTFASSKVFVRRESITIIYVSSGIDTDVFRREGLIELSIQGVPPTRLQGVWMDTMPATNRGDMMFERPTAETFERLRAAGLELKGRKFSRVQTKKSA